MAEDKPKSGSSPEKREGLFAEFFLPRLYAQPNCDPDALKSQMREWFEKHAEEIEAWDRAIGETDLDDAQRRIATAIVLKNIQKIAQSAKPGKPMCILTEIDRRVLARAQGKSVAPGNYTLQPEKREWVKWTLNFLFNIRSDEIANGEGTVEEKVASYREAKSDYRRTLKNLGLGKG